MKKQRTSNLELYRIIVMFLIICHHFVVNSEVLLLIEKDELCFRSVFFTIFGAWGKTGINCFVLITGYFMCQSCITWQKYLKLYLQVKFYWLVILFTFIYLGKDTFSNKFFLEILPFSTIGDSFTNAFMAFFLFIPFLNILIINMSKRQHLLLICLLLFIYTFLVMLGTVAYNYVSWFCVLYFIASFIRLYGLPYNDSLRFWGWTALVMFLISVASIFLPLLIGRRPTYYFVSDSNHILALLLSISSFMYFKNLKIEYSKVINSIGATTFGVFLIHTRGPVMRHWLWYDLVKGGGQYYDNYSWLYAIGCVSAIFIVCSIMDFVRIHTIEKWTFNVIGKFVNP